MALAGAATGATAGAAAGTAISPGLGTIIGAGIGALGSIGGSYLSGKSASKAAKKANEMAIWQQLNNQKFQMEMSNTAHQREMEDLKAAGLNPVLAANGGATTPNGGIGNTPAYESYDYSNTAKYAALGFEKMLELKALKNATETKDADIELKGKQGTLAETETNLAKQTAAIKQLEKDILEANKNDIIETNRATKAAERAEAETRKENADYTSENMKNPFFRGLKAFSDITSMAIGPLSQMVNMAGSASKAAALGKWSRKISKERFYGRDGKYGLTEFEYE